MASTSFDDSNWNGYDEYDSNSSVISNANDNLIIDLGQHASADFWSNVASDGGDIRVTNSAGDTAYSFELENFDSTAETGILFFNSQGLSTSSATTYRVYAGNSSASLPADSDTLGAQNVWNSSFRLVNHMEDVNDSTSNNNNGTANGGVTVGGATGKLGSATQFDGTDDYIEMTNSTSLDLPNEFTLSAWVRMSGGDENHTVIRADDFNQVTDGDREAYLIRVKSSGVGNLEFSDGSSFEILDDTGSYEDGSWHHIIGRVSQSQGTADLVIDGTQTNTLSHSHSADYAADSNTFIGAWYTPNDDVVKEFLEGYVDEARIADVYRSDNYATTEYNNQNDNATFWTNNGWTANDTGAAGTARRSHLLSM